MLLRFLPGLDLVRLGSEMKLASASKVFGKHTMEGSYQGNGLPERRHQINQRDDSLVVYRVPNQTKVDNETENSS